jgi:hypothetical protein
VFLLGGTQVFSKKIFCPIYFFPCGKGLNNITALRIFISYRKAENFCGHGTKKFAIIIFAVIKYPCYVKMGVKKGYKLTKIN